MICIISSAKTFRQVPLVVDYKYTENPFKNKTERLVDILKGYSKEELSKIMKISLNLSDINFKRYKNFYNDKANSHLGILSFDGDVFKNINAKEFSLSDLEFAQKNLIILSGLYGVIRPLDCIKEYRLEMATKLEESNVGSLYNYWEEDLTQYILECLKNTNGDKVLLNLSSNEYSKVLDLKSINNKFNVIDVIFKENKHGNLVTIGTYAKKARGTMINYIIKNKLEHSNELKKFNIDGYSFIDNLSNDKKFVFVRKI